MTVNAKRSRKRRRQAERQEQAELDATMIVTTSEVQRVQYLDNPCPCCGVVELRPAMINHELVMYCYRCGR